MFKILKKSFTTTTTPLPSPSASTSTSTYDYIKSHFKTILCSDKKFNFYDINQYLLSSRNILTFQDIKLRPYIGHKTYIAHNATVIGNVITGNSCSIWYNAIVNANKSTIRIGNNTNIQDHVIISADNFDVGDDVNKPTIIGNNVTIGHGAYIERSTIGDLCLIGNGSIVCEDSQMEEKSMLAAGGVLVSGSVIKTGELWAGNPAKFIRKLSENEQANLQMNADEYAHLGNIHNNEITTYLNENRKQAISELKGQEPSVWDSANKDGHFENQVNAISH